jgi:hypothetical protein
MPRITKQNGRRTLRVEALVWDLLLQTTATWSNVSVESI